MDHSMLNEPYNNTGITTSPCKADLITTSNCLGDPEGSSAHVSVMMNGNCCDHVNENVQKVKNSAEYSAGQVQENLTDLTSCMGNSDDDEEAETSILKTRPCVAHSDGNFPHDSDSEGEPEKALLMETEQDDPSSPKCVIPKTKIFVSSMSSPHKLTDQHDKVIHKLLLQEPMYPECPTVHPGTMCTCTVVRAICSTFVLCLTIAISCLIYGMVFATHPVCDIAHPWWQSAVVYEIFPASFQDTNGDGIGDLKGIIQRLCYIRKLNVGIIRLNSIFQAMDYPRAYENIINFTDVDPHLGTMQDFDDLISAVHGKGMHLILDLDPTITSDQHVWATNWLLQEPGEYRYYYINLPDTEEHQLIRRIHDRDENGLMSNSSSNGHLLLNLTSREVQDEILNVMHFWLNKGVDGFSIKHLENVLFTHTMDLSRLIRQWHGALGRHSLNSSRKVLVGEINILFALQELIGPRVLIPDIFDIVDVVINFSPNNTLEISDQVWMVRKWSAMYSTPPWIYWNFGNADTSRLGSRVGPKYARNCIFILAMFPGSLSLFYGDEIGLEDTFITTATKELESLPFSLMPWISQKNANFSNTEAQTWLPLNPNYQEINVETQERNLDLLKKMLSFKETTYQHIPHLTSPSVRSLSSKFRIQSTEPNYRWFHDAEKSLVILEVSYDRHHKYLLFTNFGTESSKLESLGSQVNSIPRWEDLEFSRMKVLLLDSISSVYGDSVILEPGKSVLCIYI